MALIPPVPPGMEIIGWTIWIFFVLLIGAGILIVLKSLFPNIGVGGNSNTLDETMKELLQEIRMLRREIEELRKDLKE